MFESCTVERDRNPRHRRNKSPLWMCRKCSTEFYSLRPETSRPVHGYLWSRPVKCPWIYMAPSREMSMDIYGPVPWNVIWNCECGTSFSAKNTIQTPNKTSTICFQAMNTVVPNRRWRWTCLKLYLHNPTDCAIRQKYTIDLIGENCVIRHFQMLNDTSITNICRIV
jgi:ribosomal protein L37AE/L43A